MSRRRTIKGGRIIPLLQSFIAGLEGRTHRWIADEEAITLLQGASYQSPEGLQLCCQVEPNEGEDPSGWEFWLDQPPQLKLRSHPTKPDCWELSLGSSGELHLTLEYERTLPFWMSSSNVVEELPARNNSEGLGHQPTLLADRPRRTSTAEWEIVPSPEVVRAQSPEGIPSSTTPAAAALVRMFLEGFGDNN